ncbi:MAG: tellurite resistance TerB family protein [Devosia sp.]|uniref:tellurite resistance TerB family protein n=1 Tax=Devosia sp. TaxID=1871048 RepID=UPI00263279CA|nr:tellurite resistance TerB family protein [Devosia sp.]MDB5540948.1 tellurite resistance TerB family protein [Devosia sp.]
MFNIDGIIKALQTDPNAQRTAMSGAAGLGTGMLLSGGGLGSLVGTVARVGAVAAIGGLAYTAWQQYQNKMQPAGAALEGVAPVALHDAFLPPPQAAYQNEELGKSLVRAMIAAAKADGQIDAAEKERIFKRLATMPLSSEEKAFVFDELASPLDIEAVVARANTPAHAAEIYAASLVAMLPDTPTEHGYLELLAERLNLPAGLVDEIHRHAGHEPPAPAATPAASYVPTNSV